MKPLDQESMRQLLASACDAAGGQARWALQHSASPQHVSDILLGRRGVSAKIARCLGYELRLIYLRREAKRAAK